MARKPRIHFPGALYHVVLHGSRDGHILLDNQDRDCFESLVIDGFGRFGHRIYAYCWMRDQVDLAIQVADIPLSSVIQNLAFRYARAVNRRHSRRGQVFQGRHKAILVDAAAHLPQLVRYIHLNPVRAGVVMDPCAYPWSGHRAYLGQGDVPWLSTHRVLSRFAANTTVARQRYERYVLAGTKKGCRDELLTGSDGGRLLADRRFVEHVLHSQSKRLAAKPELKWLVESACAELRLDPGTLTRPGKDRTAAQTRKWITLLYRQAGGTLTDAANYFNRDVTTLSRQMQCMARHTPAEMMPQALRRVAERLGLKPWSANCSGSRLARAGSDQRRQPAWDESAPSCLRSRKRSASSCRTT